MGNKENLNSSILPILPKCPSIHIIETVFCGNNACIIVTFVQGQQMCLREQKYEGWMQKRLKTMKTSILFASVVICH